MTTLPDRPGTALLVVDVQRGVVDHAHDRDRVVATIAGLVDRARAEGAPVVWVLDHESLEIGSEGWQLVPELVPVAGEARIDKVWGDAFEDTDLEDRLADLAVGRLVVAGAQSDACIRATIHGALTRGYDVALASDAHTTEDATEWGAPPPQAVIDHTNLYWRYHSAPGRTCEAVPAAEVSFAT